jgi:hypothetical protein
VKWIANWRRDVGHKEWTATWARGGGRWNGRGSLGPR